MIKESNQSDSLEAVRSYDLVKSVMIIPDDQQNR